MARKPVDTTIDPVLLRPQASPVDSYVDPGPSQLRGLAEALERLNVGIGAVLDKRDEKKKRDDEILGEAQFYKDNAEGYAEGVRQDRIPANASPTFVEAYRNAEGHVAGGDLRIKFQEAFNEWPGKNSGNPADYDKFVASFIKQNITTSDPRVLRGLMPQVRTLWSEGYALWTDYASKSTYNGSMKAHEAGIAQDIDATFKDGLSDPDGPDWGAVSQRITDWRTSFLASGGRTEDADKMVIDVISSKAVQLGDRALLDTLLEKVPGEEYAYADTQYGRTVRENSIDALEVMERRKDTEAAERYRLEKEIKGDASRSAITQIIADDPLAPIPEPLLTEARKWDDTIDQKIFEWRRSANQGFTDNEKLTELYRTMMANPSGAMAAVHEAMDSGVLGRPEDIRQAREFADQIKANQKNIEDLLADNLFKEIMNNLDVMTKGRNELGDPIKGMSRDGLAAQYDFQTAMMAWAMANPNATVFERQKAIMEFGKAILDRVQPGDDILTGGSYDRPPAPEGVDPASIPNPMAEPPAPGSPAAEGAPAFGNAGEARGSVDEQGVDPTTTESVITDEERQEDIDTFLNGLNPEQARVFRQQAEERGMSAEEYAGAVLGGENPEKQAQQGLPAEPPSGGTAKLMRNPFWGISQRLLKPAEGASDGETTGEGFTLQGAMDYLKQAIAWDDDEEGLPISDLPSVPDPRAAKMLHLIKQHEAAGNYNAVYGNAKATKDLSAMTLNEVLASQLAARKRGVASTAIGAYQFIYKTLRGLKKELGLTGNEMFTPELQDQLGMALMIRRGWNQFRSGKLSQRQFAKRLSQEWASLPNPETGRSYYDGDGLNASSVKSSEVYAALGLGGGGDGDDSAFGLPDWIFGGEGAPEVNPAYANIPDVDEGGNAGQQAKFMEWNSDPIGNHEAKLAEVDETLANVVRRAQELTDIRIVVGSGLRDDAMQTKAKEWGWSNTNESDHEHGGAVDLWAIDGAGAVTFDKASQKKIVDAMRQAAKELGVELDIGADWKKKRDAPHFALKK